jgi:hypothetical protein
MVIMYLGQEAIVPQAWRVGLHVSPAHHEHSTLLHVIQYAQSAGLDIQCFTALGWVAVHYLGQIIFDYFQQPFAIVIGLRASYEIDGSWYESVLRKIKKLFISQMLKFIIYLTEGV